MLDPARTRPALASEGEDDFVCLRYQVPYPSFDCALRTFFKTSPGCRACPQGRFNLKRHRAEVVRVRFPLPPAY